MAFDCDVLICGGGVAGLSAAALFGGLDFDVICVDPVPPVTAPDAPGADLRTTALLQPAQALLDRAGIWSRFGDAPAPLNVMRIVEANGQEGEASLTRDFKSSDISEKPFGWNVPNWLLRREMVAHIQTLDTVTFLAGTALTSLLTREKEARVSLSDGRKLRARLVVGADGRDSFVRDRAGIDVRRMRYGQKALSFAVTHEAPHDNISTEVHRSGGPFTLVPLPDHEGRPCSAIVWMDSGPEIQRLAALPVAHFEAEMTVRSGHIYGPLKLASRLSVWPIISQIADRMWAERVALIAEAAHVVPPIGAQGLNMSLTDLDVLTDLAEASPGTLGDAEMLKTYHKRRYPDVQLRVTGIDALNRASQAGVAPLRDLRALGLNALYALPPVRRSLMQMGLGSTG